jgi:hypothetical protein
MMRLLIACPFQFPVEVVSMIPVLAAITSAIVSVVSAFIAWRAVTRNLRPVLVFVRDEHRVWFVRNVGNGPALDVLVAQKDLNDQPWHLFLRLPPIPKDGQIPLRSGPSFLAVIYTDVEDNPYSTICSGFRNRPQKGRVFDEPDERQIKLYADVPLKPPS